MTNVKTTVSFHLERLCSIQTGSRAYPVNSQQLLGAPSSGATKMAELGQAVAASFNAGFLLGLFLKP
jgi:hypothetical protein